MTDRTFVSLTYDGTQICHAETVLPQLEAVGLRATFYADPLNLLEEPDVWRSAVAQGHEVGNGCLLDCGPLDSWTPEMVMSDIEETDALLQELFPSQLSYSFAYPWSIVGCPHTDCLRRIVEQRHRVCRSAQPGNNDLDSTDIGFVLSYPMDGHQATAMSNLVSEGNSQWTVFAFAGVGSGEPSVDASAHEDFVNWLAQQSVSVLPVSSVAEAVGSGAMRKVRLI